jgi:hypothetical protein
MSSSFFSSLKSNLAKQAKGKGKSSKKDDSDDDDNDSKLEDKEDKEEEEDKEEGEPLKGVLDAFGELVGSERLADVHFLVTEGKKQERIPAHRLVLAANNDVFRAMLYPLEFTQDGKARYSTKVDEKDIVIDDCSPAAFKKMLACMYTDKVEIGAPDLKELVPLAKRFQVESLRLACVEFMEEDVTVETACALFEEGRKLLNEAHFGLKFIEENATEVCDSPGFANLSRECLVTVLKSPNLCIQEADLFDAVDRWAEAECKRQKQKPDADNKRTALGDALNMIRFPTMSMSEVCTKVQASGMLNPDELLQLFTWLGASKDSKPKVKWPTREREGGGLFDKSNILDAKQQQILSKMHDKNGKARWDLVYSGKRDGLSGYTFHAKCDNAGPTMSIIRAQGTKYIFGGFTEQAWSGSGYKGDMKAFLFSLVNSRGKPIKLPCQNTTYSISCQAGSGPCFGGGNNIYCAPSMNTNQNYCAQHNSYAPEDNTVQYTQDLLAGAYNFTVDDIEVYALKKKS